MPTDVLPPPRWAPDYAAGPGAAFRRFWTGYVRFTGRAGRAEFWWWMLLDAVVTAALAGAALLAGGRTVALPTAGVPTVGLPTVGLPTVALLALGAWTAATLLPVASLAARRMHDVDLSAWVLLAVLIPSLGAAALLVVAALPSNPAGARFDRPDAGDPHIPEVPGGEAPARDYGWPPLPLPYAGPAGGQPLFDDPADDDRPG